MLCELTSPKRNLEQIVSATATSPSAESPSAVADFRDLLASLTRQLAGKPLDAHLDAWLNQEHGVGSTTYQQLKSACIDGVAQGWLCKIGRAHV